jgi:hypothetical protein
MESQHIPIASENFHAIPTRFTEDFTSGRRMTTQSLDLLQLSSQIESDFHLSSQRLEVPSATVLLTKLVFSLTDHLLLIAELSCWVSEHLIHFRTEPFSCSRPINSFSVNSASLHHAMASFFAIIPHCATSLPLFPNSPSFHELITLFLPNLSSIYDTMTYSLPIRLLCAIP